ncbi:alpha/beta hydrolase [Xinfangfangia pollutisoli]|uniref:alpha/beta hydrolase n=1 Tax=Xinfangfangia pollutisoli TaxID=2865960 RepID=UPI001CD42EA5|nr:alpha/beta hydrolase [Xinfangfangia pollutisoli]
MRRIGARIAAALLALAAVLALIWALAPQDRVDREISFDPARLGADLDQYLAREEARFPDITPGTQKRILWAGAPGVQTPLAVVYLHGFSATGQEIRPVPDEVAKALGANLFFTRLAGHGRGPDAMAEPEAGDWIEDTAEALAIGRRLGQRVLVISTSTGGTLAAIAATDPLLNPDLAGIVMVSPNFGLRLRGAFLLDLPFARVWAPWIAGDTLGVDTGNAERARYWTTRYPSVAAFPMAALLREARGLDYTRAKMPLLVIYAPEDQVIDPAAIWPVTQAWGGKVRIEPRQMQAGDDPMRHVIAGDILSPGQTEAVVDLILDWAKGWAQD